MHLVFSDSKVKEIKKDKIDTSTARQIIIRNRRDFIKFTDYQHCVKSVSIRSFSGPYFPIRTEYGGIPRISPYSARMRENRDQKKGNTDTFHVVQPTDSLTANHRQIKF